MSDTTPTEALTRGLDAVLLAQIEADEEWREREREYRAASDRFSKLAGEAQRMRLALFALEGASSKNAADANVANEERVRELKREATE